MPSKYINVPEVALDGFTSNARRIEIADLYNDQIHTILNHMVHDGRITQAETNELEDLMLYMVGESEQQSFISGVRYGVQFMSFAMQGIETNEPASSIKFEHSARNRAHYGK